jgi:hypothetical protein
MRVCGFPREKVSGGSRTRYDAAVMLRRLGQAASPARRRLATTTVPAPTPRAATAATPMASRSAPVVGSEPVIEATVPPPGVLPCERLPGRVPGLPPGGVLPPGPGGVQCAVQVGGGLQSLPWQTTQSEPWQTVQVEPWQVVQTVLWHVPQSVPWHTGGVQSRWQTGGVQSPWQTGGPQRGP